MSDKETRNLNPHKAARVAMLLWGNRYAAQNGGSMEFWNSLTDRERELCREVLGEILEAPPEETAPALRPYMDRLLKKLADPSEAFHYINAAWQESPEVFIQAVKDVAQAVAVECRAPAPQPAERSDKDYAIEHAEYLAKSVEHYQATKNAFAEFMESADRDRDEEVIDQFRSDLSESWRGMNFCIFEFRKRANRAAATPQVTPLITFSKGAPAGVNMQALAHSCYLTNPEGTSEQAPPELELELEADGRWLAEFTRFPGVAAYGPSKEEAIWNAAKVLIESEQRQRRRNRERNEEGI